MKQKHIYIIDKGLCSGCSACKAVCPKSCISMHEDAMGSKYPKVDTSKCIQCGACEKVCPFLKPSSTVASIKCYASVNRNEDIRIVSSSGGVFRALAQHIIDMGGVVCGAVFTPDWDVEHILSGNVDDVERMMGSKYVQSETSSTYLETREQLISGRIVLFTGTPCQIAGLNHFLRRDYANLITVEVICHGVPERKVWKSYLQEIIARPTGERAGKNTVLQPPLKEKNTAIGGISFRDKRKGWKKYGFALLLASIHGGKKNSVLPYIMYEPFQENEYMKAFLQNLSLRPSCYNCKAKSGNSHADITIGDFWGIEHTDIMHDDDKGISAIVCRSNKGLTFMQKCTDLHLVECSYHDILKSNPSMEKSVDYTQNARTFHEKFPKRGFRRTMRYIDHPSFFRKVQLSLKYRMSRFTRKAQ